MKKHLKSVLSFFLVLVIALQFAGLPAAADDADVEVTGKEALIYALYIPNPEAKETDKDKLLPVPADKEAEMLGGKTCSVVLGHEDTTVDPPVKPTPLTRTAGTITLAELLKEDLVITPPEGFVIDKVYLRGDEVETQPIKLLPFTADAEKTEITLKAGAVGTEDEDGKQIFDKDVLTTFSTVNPQIYTLVIELAPVDKEKDLTVTKTVDGDKTESKVKPGEAYTVPELPEDTDTHAYTGWLLRYANGAALKLTPGKEIKPYADCTVEAQWTEIITLTANTPVEKDGGFVPNGCVYSGNLAEGDEITAVTLTVTEQDGAFISTPSNAVVKNGEDDVTDHYQFKYVASAPAEAEKEAEKTKLTVTAKPPVKNADGSGYVANGYELTEGALAEGDALSVEITVKQNENGKYVAVPVSAAVKNGEDDHSDLYQITLVSSAEVDPDAEKIAITIRSKDRSAEYSGAVVTADSYELTAGALAEGDTIVVTYSGGTDKVTTEPVVSGIASVTIKDKDGNDVTAAKYTVTIDNENAGKVTVTRKVVTITAITGTVETDGNTVIKASECRTANDVYTKGHKVEGLLPGHQLRGDFVLGSGKETFTTSIDKDAVKIVDVNNGEADVTANYDIHTVDGKLTIKVVKNTDIPIAITLRDQSWVYDGTARTLDQTAYSISGLLDGDVATVSLTIKQGDTTLDSVTNAGTYTIVPVVTIKDKNGAVVNSAKYKINAGTATLTVKKFDLTLEAVSASKPYDGKPLRNDNVKASALVSGHKFRSGDGVKFTVTDGKGNLVTNGVVNVGTYTKHVTEVHIVDSRGNDVTDNYNITKIDGKLTITQGTTDKNNSNQPKTGDSDNTIVRWVFIGALVLLLGTVFTFFVIQDKKRRPRVQQSVYQDGYFEPDEAPEDWQRSPESNDDGQNKD